VTAESINGLRAGGCFSKVLDEINAHSGIIGGVAIGVVVVMVKPIVLVTEYILFLFYTTGDLGKLKKRKQLHKNYCVLLRLLVRHAKFPYCILVFMKPVKLFYLFVCKQMLAMHFVGCLLNFGRKDFPSLKTEREAFLQAI
jgi:hypothetical protein